MLIIRRREAAFSFWAPGAGRSLHGPRIGRKEHTQRQRIAIDIKVAERPQAKYFGDRYRIVFAFWVGFSVPAAMLAPVVTGALPASHSFCRWVGRFGQSSLPYLVGVEGVWPLLSPIVTEKRSQVNNLAAFLMRFGLEDRRLFYNPELDRDSSSPGEAARSGIVACCPGASLRSRKVLLRDCR
jgi:hypothetical protein